MESIKKEPELHKKEEIIKINNYPGIKQVIIPETTEALQKFGEGAIIKIPVGDDKLIYFEARFLPGYQERCSQEFDEFLKTVSIQ